MQDFIGCYMDQELETEMLKRLGRPVDIMPYGTMGTMESREGRVRVWLAQDNTVNSITFG
jgi:hypothetical protein